MKASLAAVGLCVALVVSVASPALAAEPQENPDIASVVYDGVALLQKYSQVLDNVLAGDAAGAGQLQAEAIFANLPPELDTAAGSFFSSGISLASLLPVLRKDLDDANAYLAQYRVDDAERVMDNAQQGLIQAYSNLLAMNISAVDTGSWGKAESAPAGSTLRQAYDEVQEKLLRLRRLLDLNDNIRRTVNNQVLGLYEKLRQAANNSTDVMPFSSTSLSLFIEPTVAFVGENVSFHGVLASGNTPLPGKNVIILLDRSPVMTVSTGAGGAYRGTVALPFRYSSNITLQAVYSPLGDDINRYLGCSSPEVAISVLFYQAVLHVTQGTPASPGRDFLVQGAFNYGNNIALPERLLHVSLDDNPVFDGPIGPGFFLRLPVAANTSRGRHRLTFDAPADGRYAPALAFLDVEVSLIVPKVYVNVPAVVLLPFSQQIRGSVRSEIGPLSNTTVLISLGDWKTSVLTGADGNFSGRLDTGLSLTFLGAQYLHVTATPRLPWYSFGSNISRILVINPVNIAGIIVILLVLAVSGTRRLGRKGYRPVPPGENSTPVPGPVLIKPEITATPAPATPGDPRSVLLSLYQAVLRFVLRITGMILPPQKTLREFAAENGPKLGLLGGYFREFTLMIERLLYSRHDFDERDVARARELSGKILKGAGDENS